MDTKKLTLALVASLAAGSVLAQAQIGNVTSVNGVATVTTGTVGTAIGPGAPIVEGARVITTTTGNVTFRLANGCTVSVPPGHAVTVSSAMPCQQLQASVRPVTTAVQTTTATTSTTTPAGVGIGAASPAVVGGFAALLTIGAIAADRNNDDNTPLSAQ